MSNNFNEKYKDIQEKIKNREQEERKQKRYERNEENKKNNYRKFLIGELVLKYFPELSDLNGHKGKNYKAKNDIEFISLKYFLEILSDNKELMALLKKKVMQKHIQEKLFKSQPNNKNDKI